MNDKLTDRQLEVLCWVKDYISINGYPLTRSDISKGMGMKSPNAAHEHLLRIERNGYIEVHYRVARGIKIVTNKGQRSGPGGCNF